MRTYAVTWRHGSGIVHAGKLELGAAALVLDGGSAHETLRYDELAEVRVGRGSEERLQGRPALVLRDGHDELFYVASVDTPGVVAELAESLAALAGS